MSGFSTILMKSHKYLLVLIIISTTLGSLGGKEMRNKTDMTNKEKVSNYFPKKVDLGVYLAALQKAANYFQRHSIDKDLSVNLFIVNLNLKLTIRDYIRKIPHDIKDEMNSILRINDKILDIYNGKVLRFSDPRNKSSLEEIQSLFMNDKPWIKRLVSLERQKLRLHKPYKYHDLEQMFPKWEKYLRMNGKCKPIELCNSCTASVAQMKIHHVSTSPRCSLSNKCVYFLLNGTDYGYTLTNRIIMMMSAVYGRGCVLSTPAKDRKILTRFCNLAYAEAQFIDYNNVLDAIDLLMEQISLCFLIGYREFVRSSWLFLAIKRQRDAGCFGFELSDTLPEIARLVVDQNEIQKKWSVARPSLAQDFINGMCNAHFTAVAMAALSSGVRYIISSKKFSKFKPYYMGEKKIENYFK